RARKDAARPKDAKGLLAAARESLRKGDLEMAEQLAQQADKVGRVWDSMSHLWSDSPAKVLKDVQAEKARQQMARQTTPRVTNQPAAATVQAPKVLKIEDRGSRIEDRVVGTGSG